MWSIKIKSRETIEYAMALPTMLKVDIKNGITVDKRDDVYWRKYGGGGQ